MKTKVFHSLVVVLFAHLIGGCACRFVPPDANTPPLILDHEQHARFLLWGEAIFPAGIYKPVFKSSAGPLAGVFYRSPKLFALNAMMESHSVIGGFYVPTAENKSQRFSIWWRPGSNNEELTISEYSSIMQTAPLRGKIEFRQ